METTTEKDDERPNDMEATMRTTRKTRTTTKVLANIIGTKICRRFDDGKYYRGCVVSGPKDMKDDNDRLVQCWKVRYPDGDEEDLSKEEILDWAITNEDQQHVSSPSTPAAKSPAVASVTPSATKKRKNTESAYDKAKRDLSYRVGITEEEVVTALAQMKPPYSLNEAMQLIHKAKIEKEEDLFSGEEDNGGGKFCPKLGLRIRKYVEGCAYYGTVTSEAEMKTDQFGNEIKMWEVTFEAWEDEDKCPTVEDYDFHELLASRADRPVHTHPVRGRQLYALELFSGCSTVTQEFASRQWRVRSIDNCKKSYATDQVDIMKMTFKNLQMVPDFIWASPPCKTYSRLAGGRHRSNKPGSFDDNSKEAQLHNRYFARLMFLLKWVKERNPHVIVVIENPQALMAEMPLMKNFEESFGLVRALVHYCALGRFDKKPTHLWTNDRSLHATLSTFTCSPSKCHYYGKQHPMGVRGQGHLFNAAAIPKALAEEVADHVHSTFYFRRLRCEKAFVVTAEDEEAFNLGMSSDV